MSSRKLLSIAQKWPADPFRPNMQLKTFLASLSTHPDLTPRAVAATEALLSDKLKNKYTLDPKTTRPASYPEHYRRLIDAFDNANRGVQRPWWKIMFGIY